MANIVTKGKFIEMVDALKGSEKVKKTIVALVKAHDAATVKEAAAANGLNE